MSDTNAYIAEMLRISARAYAARAAEQLLERHPDCAAQFDGTAFPGWQDNLTRCVYELAVALELDEPSLFAAQLEWSRDAFAAREVPVEHLRHSLECLRIVLGEELPEGTGDQPVAVIDRALERLGNGPAQRSRLAPDSDASRVALRYVEAVLGGDRQRAIRVVLDVVERGLPVADAYERVLLPAQAEIGVMWHLGEITVPEEHAATETTRTVMALLSRNAAAEADDGPTALVAAVEGDRHDIGTRAVADLLEMNGFRVVLLGCDVPIRDLARSVTDFSPDVAILGASLSLHLRHLRRSIGAIRDMDNGGSVRIVVGGPAFGELQHLAERLAADGFAASPGRAVELAQRLTRAG